METQGVGFVCTNRHDGADVRVWAGCLDSLR